MDTIPPTVYIAISNAEGEEVGCVGLGPAAPHEGPEGSVYLEVSDGDVELRFCLSPEAVAQIREFLP